MYIHRNITSNLLEFIQHFPVVCIIGPRQVGKTTLVKEITRHVDKKCVYLDLELPEDFSKLTDPQIYLEQHEEKCVILDEIQRIPDLFTTLRSLVDRKRDPGRFVILGSASPDLLKQSSETLAGRIVYVELSPFNLTEIDQDHEITDHWFRGGFPEAFLSKKSSIYKKWMQSFVQTYLERDLRLLGLSADSVLMRRLWTMIAHYHGGIWNASTFAKSLGISVPTVNRYLNFLEAAFIIRQLEPYFYNIKKRLVKSPKIYIRDSGILHFLTGIDNLDTLHGHTLIGNSWEGYVIEQIHQLLHDDLKLYFYRTHHGAESDLVLVKGLEPISCIEIKYTSQPNPSKGFQIAVDDLKTQINFIITPKSETYRTSKSSIVCNLQEFLSEHLVELG
jgi:predicted AAA+ superfamily ATPase